MSNTNIIAQVQWLERKGDVVEVGMAATGPIKMEDLMEKRARGKALLVAGVLDASINTIKQIPKGETERLTEVKSVKPGEDVEIDSVPILGKLLQTKVYVIEVQR